MDNPVRPDSQLDKALSKSSLSSPSTTTYKLSIGDVPHETKECLFSIASTSRHLHNSLHKRQKPQIDYQIVPFLERTSTRVLNFSTLPLVKNATPTPIRSSSPKKPSGGSYMTPLPHHGVNIPTSSAPFMSV